MFVKDWMFWPLVALVIGFAYIDIRSEMAFTENTRLGLYEAAAVRVPR